MINPDEPADGGARSIEAWGDEPACTFDPERGFELNPGKLTPMQTAELIKQSAKLYPTQPRRLDHIIWRHFSGREIFREDELN